MSSGIGLSLIMNRPFDRTPYESEEVFDAWVSNLQSTIDAALHPPRKPLFPDPEPTYNIPKAAGPSPKPVASSSRIPPGGDVFSIQRPALQERTTSPPEPESDEDEEQWPLPSVLGGHGHGRADEVARRRSGELTLGDEHADEPESDEDESFDKDNGMGDELEDEQSASPDPPQRPANRAGVSAATAHVLSDSSDEDEVNESDQDQLEDEPYYDEEDEQEYGEDEQDAATALPAHQWTGDLPPAQSRRGGEQPGFSSALDLKAAQDYLSATAGPSSAAVEGRDMSDIIELGSSDDEQPSATGAAHLDDQNGLEPEEDSYDEEGDDDEDALDEDVMEDDDQPMRRSRDPFAPQSRAFPPRSTQPTNPMLASRYDMEDEEEDQLDEASSVAEGEPGETGLGLDEDLMISDDDIMAYFPPTQEPIYFNADEGSATPDPAPADSRDATLSPISASLRQALATADDTEESGSSQEVAEHKADSPEETEQVDDAQVPRGLFAYLGQMEPPKEDLAPPLAPPQIDRTLLDVQAKAVDLSADQLGRPVEGGAGSMEVIERDEELVEWHGDEPVQPEPAMTFEDFFNADLVDPEVARVFEAVADASMPAQTARETTDAEPAAVPDTVSQPLATDAPAPPSPLKDRELDLKSQLRQRLLAGKAKAKQKSPPPPPSSSTWQPSPTRLPSMSGSTLSPSVNNPDEYDLEHDAAIQPHPPPAPSSVKLPVDAFEREHDAAIQPSSSAVHHSSHRAEHAHAQAHAGIGPSPAVEDAPVYHAPGPSAPTSANVAEKMVIGLLDSSDEDSSDDDIIAISPPARKAIVVEDEEEVEEEVDEIDATREGSVDADTGADVRQVDQPMAEDALVESQSPTVAAPADSLPPSASASEAAASQHPSGSTNVPTAESIAGGEENMVEVGEEDSDEMASTGSRTPIEEDELEEDADSALAKELRGETVRASLEAINAAARDQTDVGGEEQDELDLQAENASVPDDPADFIPLDAGDEAEEKGTGASSPLYFPPSSSEDQTPSLPSIFAPQQPEASTSPKALAEVPKTIPAVPALATQPSPARVLPGVAKPGLWNADSFPPFSSPGAGPSKALFGHKESTSPVTTAAELPDPRFTPPPTSLITPDVPASLEVPPSLMVEAPQTRQASPIPSGQPDLGVDGSEPQVDEMNAAYERNLAQDEEYASDSVPLEDEPAVIPAYVEPELDDDGSPLIEDDFPSGPPSAAFSPLVDPSALPDPGLEPAPTDFAIPAVPRDLSEVATSVASQAPESRAITPSLDGDTAEEDAAELDLGLVDDGDTFVMVPATLADDSDSGSSDDDVDYALDVDKSRDGDSDDEISASVEAAPREEPGPARVVEDAIDVDDGQPLEAEAVDSLLDELAGDEIEEDEDAVPSSDAAEVDAPLLESQPSTSSRTALGAAISKLSNFDALPSILKSSGHDLPPLTVDAPIAQDAVAPKPLIFAEPESFSPFEGSPAPDSPAYSPGPSRPPLLSSSSAPPIRSLSYHVHGSSRASTSVIPSLHRSESASTTTSVHPAPSHPSAVPHPSPTRNIPSALPPSLSQSQPRSSVPSSPVTRSQCVYHLLRIPGPTRYSEAMIFVVPYCSFAGSDSLKEEHARILGKASDEDNAQRKPIVGEDAIVLDEEMEQKLTRVCGIDIVRAGDCFYLRSVPREADDRSESESSSDEQAAQPKPSSSKPSSAYRPPSKGKPSSSGPKRKKPMDSDDFNPRAESSDEDVKSSPTKKRSPRKRESLSPAKGKAKELPVEAEVEVAEAESEASRSNSVKRKRSEGEALAEKENGEEADETRDAKKVKAVEAAPTRRASLFGRLFGKK